MEKNNTAIKVSLISFNNISCRKQNYNLTELFIKLDILGVRDFLHDSLKLVDKLSKLADPFHVWRKC